MSPLVKSCTVTEGWTVYIVCSIHKQPKKSNKFEWKTWQQESVKVGEINNIPEWVHRRYDYSNFDPLYMGLADFWMEEFLYLCNLFTQSAKILLK